MSAEGRTRTGPENEAAASRCRPSASISRKAARTCRASRRLASPMCVRATSHRRLQASMPHADSTAESLGTMTRFRSSWRATSVTCSAAAPPNERMAKRLGSTPRRTETSRMPSAMCVLMTPMDPRRGGHAIHAEPVGDAIDGHFGGMAVETRPPAEKVVGVEEAEDQVGVRHRRLGAAAAVAGGARLRRRRSRGRHGARHCRRRARSSRRRPDAGDVEALRRYALAGNAPVGRNRGFAANDERDVCRGAAHVERDQVAMTQQPRGILASGDAAGGAREHAASCQPHGLGDGGDAAVRLDDQHRCAQARLA